jgi:hypothetical protein
MSIKHPHRSSLLEYAEGLIDSTAALAPEVALHVSKCTTCKSVVSEMRSSLDVINGVEEIEANGDLKASIVLAARNTPIMPTQTVSSNIFGKVTLVASLIVVVMFAWDATHQQTAKFISADPAQNISVTQATVLPAMDVSPTNAEKILAVAVQGSHRQPSSDWERAQHRALDVFDDDIAEAEIALVHNPGFRRASNVVTSIRERKGRVLKDVYIEGR